MLAAAKNQSQFMQVLKERGYVHQVSDENALDAAAAKAPITGYIGFDCTAPSLHVGNLVSIMMLRRLQQAGHKPIVADGRRHDQGRRSVGQGRKPQAADRRGDRRQHARASSTAFDKFLTFGDGPTRRDDGRQRRLAGASCGYIDFLRDVGAHFTINRMLTFDSVKLRLEREQPLTFLEFNYMILQAYDFLELARRHGCGLQMGGSDQWGNIVNGVELTPPHRRHASCSA